MPQWVVGALSVAAALALVHVTGANRYIEDADRFPGWKGELPKEPDSPKALDQKPTGETVGYGEDGKVRPGLVFLSYKDAQYRFSQV
jgi:hypothetical protein